MTYMVWAWETLVGQRGKAGTLYVHKRALLDSFGVICRPNLAVLRFHIVSPSARIYYGTMRIYCNWPAHSRGISTVFYGDEKSVY
jgi:hypothetical protein